MNERYDDHDYDAFGDSGCSDSGEHHFDESFASGVPGEYGVADELAAAWFDEGSAADAAEPLETGDSLRLADLAFLHALLEKIHLPTNRNTEDRIQRVMTQIDREADGRGGLEKPRPAELVSTLWRVGRWAFPSFTAAAILVAGATYYWIATPGRSAYAAVQRAYLDAARAKDRQYDITTDVRISNSHSMSIESKLNCRGNDKFTLRHPVLAGQAWFGCNGHEAWMVPAIGHTRTDIKPTAVMDWIRKQGLNIPDAQISALINFLASSFELELLPNEKLPTDGDILWQRVRGVRREETNEKPQYVELWAHPETGIARKLVFAWNRKPDQLGVTRITFDLTGEEPQPDSWYEAAGHQPLPILPFPTLAPVAQP